MKTLAAALALIFVIGAVPAAAQDVRIQAPTPGKDRPEKPGTGAQEYDRARPSDHDYFPEGPRVGHDPAFVEGMSTQHEGSNTSGRVGVAGWTSPNTPVGPEVAGKREVTGWFGFGFAVTWGGPPRPLRPAAAK
jgi:hypothetical protein